MKPEQLKRLLIVLSITIAITFVPYLLGSLVLNNIFDAWALGLIFTFIVIAISLPAIHNISKLCYWIVNGEDNGKTFEDFLNDIDTFFNLK